MKILLLKGYDECEIRSDSAGDGHFGARRGDHTHTGVDFVCKPGGVVTSPVHGMVTKLGYPYASGYGGVSDPVAERPYRYVQITVGDGVAQVKKHHRVFYIDPSVKLGQLVRPGNMIGSAMDVSLRYPKEEEDDDEMTPHIHLEIMLKGRMYEDPEDFEYPEAVKTGAARPRRGSDG